MWSQQRWSPTNWSKKSRKSYRKDSKMKINDFLYHSSYKSRHKRSKNSMLLCYLNLIIICVEQYSFVLITFLKLSFKPLSSSISLLTFPTFEIIFELALVDRSVHILPDAVSLSDSFDKLSLVVASICPLVLTLSMRLALFVHTYVLISVCENLFSFSIF